MPTTKVAASEAASENSEKAVESTSASPSAKASVDKKAMVDTKTTEKSPTTKVKKDDAPKKEDKKSAPQGGGGKTEKKVSYKNPFSFKDPLQTKVVNCIMKDGKKTIAQQILKDTFDELSRKGQKNPLKTFEIAITNAKPSMEVKAKRIGGAVYQIPLEVPAKRQDSLAIRWILEGARKKKGMPMYKRLALELLDAFNESGYAYTKREDAHKMAQANKAFAHLARY